MSTQLAVILILCMIVSIFCDECTAAICPQVLDEMAPHPLFIRFNDAESISLREAPPRISKRNAAVRPFNIEWIDGEHQDGDDDFYTILMVDPDAPSRSNPVMAEWLHWLVVNVKNNFNNINGEDTTTIMDYAGPTPPRRTRDHRYCIYVFKQLGGQDPNLASLQFDRPKFNTRAFLESDGADLRLIGANKFLANYDN